jgi:hypothetical protein
VKHGGSLFFWSNVGRSGVAGMTETIPTVDLLELEREFEQGLLKITVAKTQKAKPKTHRSRLDRAAILDKLEMLSSGAVVGGCPETCHPLLLPKWQQWRRRLTVGLLPIRVKTAENRRDFRVNP